MIEVPRLALFQVPGLRANEVRSYQTTEESERLMGGNHLYQADRGFSSVSYLYVPVAMSPH